MKKLLLLASVLGACASVDSDNILTSGIYADISARADGSGTTTVSATLFLEDPLSLNFVELTGDDELVATFDGESKVMSETNVLNIVQHHATFQSDLEGDEFVVAFEREVDSGAPESIATLPAEFDIVEPLVTDFARGDEMTFEWGPSGAADLMSWQATGDCIDSVLADVDDDPGLVIVPADTFRKRTGNQIPDSCTVTLTLTRTRLGELDRGYGEGGRVVGQQVRTMTFTSTP